MVVYALRYPSDRSVVVYALRYPSDQGQVRPIAIILVCKGRRFAICFAPSFRSGPSEVPDNFDLLLYTPCAILQIKAEEAYRDNFGLQGKALCYMLCAVLQIGAK